VVNATYQEYKVTQFFASGYEKVPDYFAPEEAMRKAVFFTKSVAAQLGLTKRVIITNFDKLMNYVYKVSKNA
jgi:hypothetical protein